MLNGTSCAGGLREEQGAGVATGFVFNQGGFGPVSGFEGHWQAGLTQGETLFIEQALGEATPAHEGHSGKTAGLIEVFVDIKRIEGSIQGTVAWFTA